MQLINNDSVAYYNDKLGDLYPGNREAPLAQYFTGPNISTGDPTADFSIEPDLSSVSGLQDWLINPEVALDNGSWSDLQPIPRTWTVNTETAIIYEVDGGRSGFKDVTADFGIDNGILVWVNGEYTFGDNPRNFSARDVDLGDLNPGQNYIQILRADYGVRTGYSVDISGTEKETPRVGEFIRGTQGKDILRGSAGNDVIFALGGNDKIRTGSGQDKVLAGDGNDRVVGCAGNDLLLGGAGNDRLIGDAGNDVLQGGRGRDLLIGGIGNDLLLGGADDDVIRGGSGNDRLVGGVGDDQLTGGQGKDRFVLSAGLGTDTIQDFDKGMDKIELSGVLRFGNISISQTSRNTFITFGNKTLAQLNGNISLVAQDFTTS